MTAGSWGLYSLGRGHGSAPIRTSWNIAEFFVVRGARRKNVGLAAAHALFDAFPTRWEVRVRTSNTAALRFWARVVEADRHPHSANCSRDRRWTRWKVFRLESPTSDRPEPSVRRCSRNAGPITNGHLRSGGEISKPSCRSRAILAALGPAPDPRASTPRPRFRPSARLELRQRADQREGALSSRGLGGDVGREGGGGALEAREPAGVERASESWTSTAATVVWSRSPVGSPTPTAKPPSNRAERVEVAALYVWTVAPLRHTRRSARKRPMLTTGRGRRRARTCPRRPRRPSPPLPERALARARRTAIAMSFGRSRSGRPSRERSLPRALRAQIRSALCSLARARAPRAEIIFEADDLEPPRARRGRLRDLHAAIAFDAAPSPTSRRTRGRRPRLRRAIAPRAATGRRRPARASTRGTRSGCITSPLTRSRIATAPSRVTTTSHSRRRRIGQLAPKRVALCS